MKFLTAIVTVSLVIMITASAGYYFYNNSINESSYPSYHVDMYLNTTPYYPIHLNSNLTGNGTYQQLLTFSDPSIYGINSQGSNVLFYASNGTELYAWLQSINGTSASYWIKNFNGSATINMQVLPSFENLFSANGYIGKNGTLTDNGAMVFLQYTSFFNISVVSGWTLSSSFAINDGLHITNVSSLAVDYTNASYAANGSRILDFGVDTPEQITPGRNSQFGYVSSAGSYAGWLLYDSLGFNNLAIFASGTANYTNTFYGSHLYGVRMSANKVSGQIDDGALVDNVSGGFTGAHIGVYNTASLNPYTIYFEFQAVYLPSMPTFTIGSGTNMTDHVDASYLSNSITIPIPNWFNLTLKAYTNYSFTFQYNNTPLYFTYDGLINNTIYTGFFDHNLTLDIHFIALGYSGKTQSIVLERG